MEDKFKLIDSRGNLVIEGIEAYESGWSRFIQAKKNADRRLELLKKMPEFIWDFEQEALFCIICGANSNHGHLRDCALARELGIQREE